MTFWQDIDDRISIHALLAESDVTSPKSVIYLLDISIHALLAESDYVMYNSRLVNANFYPRSPCGERLGAPVDKMPSSSISIHALLAESDSSRFLLFGIHPISIHALLAESDSKVNCTRAR